MDSSCCCRRRHRLHHHQLLAGGWGVWRTIDTRHVFTGWLTEERLKYVLETQVESIVTLPRWLDANLHPVSSARMLQNQLGAIAVTFLFIHVLQSCRLDWLGRWPWWSLPTWPLRPKLKHNSGRLRKSWLNPFFFLFFIFDFWFSWLGRGQDPLNFH